MTAGGGDEHRFALAAHHRPAGGEDEDEIRGHAEHAHVGRKGGREHGRQERAGKRHQVLHGADSLAGLKLVTMKTVSRAESSADGSRTARLDGACGFSSTVFTVPRRRARGWLPPRPEGVARPPAW